MGAILTTAGKTQRAWSTLTVKSIQEDQRVITGIATSASTDRMGDVVEPDGAEFELPIPLLWQHDSRAPIGQVTKAKMTKDGWEITAQIAKTDEPGQLKDRLDMAWQSIKLGLVRGLSIGFKSLEESYNKESGGFHFLKWLWLELSAVTIPANSDASIMAIKAVDIAVLEAAAQTTKTTPGASGSPRVIKMARSGPSTMKKTIAEQIASWEATRASKAARQEEIQTKAAEAGVAKNAEESEEFNDLEAELKGIDQEIADLKILEKRAVTASVPARGDGPGEASRTRTSVITVEKKLPPGVAFAQYAMCVAMSKGIGVEAERLARQHYPDNSGILKLIQMGSQVGELMQLRQKTGVGAAAVVTSHWADDLVPYNILDDFIEYLRPGSIVGKFGTVNPGGGGNYPALRRVPFNIRVSGASAGLTGAWVGEGLPALPSKMTTFNATLTWAKVAALAVLTKEEIRFSNPSAEMVVRDDIARAVNARLDVDFVDPAKAAVANVSPASITYGIAAVTPTGTNAAAFRTDLATLINAFAVANLDPSDIVLIMSASMALELSMMVNTLGNNDFPDITMKGGMVRGFPVIVSQHLSSVGSPSTETIVAVKASDVYLADDGVVTVDASDQASVEMQDSSSQSGISGTGASLVSLWQTGMVGLLATREISWKLRRSTACGYISPAAYKA